MKLLPVLLTALCSFAAQSATLPDAEGLSCVEIRDRVTAQVGLLPKPDVVLLRILGVRADCSFTAAEVYRAAYGDKPLPPGKPIKNRRSCKHHDDGD